MLVKICGTTNLEDARLAHDAGADYFGIVVQHAPSPRSVSVEEAIMLRDNTSLPAVALTVNQPLEFLLDLAACMRPAALQLHGDESAGTVLELTRRGHVVWKALSGEPNVVLHQAAAMRAAGASAILLDARAVKDGETVYGGTGQRSDWELAQRLVQDGHKLILAGGLGPQNVAAAIEAVRPWAVDCVSGVEASKGHKDARAVRQFVFNARGA